jgi:hypothetical protein
MDKKIIIYFCLLGFVIRAAYSIFFNPDITFSDEERFWAESAHILNDQTLRTYGGKYAHDMPLTAMLIAAASYATGGSILGVKLVLAGVSAITIYVIAMLAYVIHPSRQSALIAAIFATFYPFFIYYSSLLLSETLFLLFLTYFFVQLLNHQTTFWHSSVTAGLVHLTRPTVFYFMPIIWVWQYLLRFISTKQLAVIILLFVLIILPWGIRNAITLDHFSVTTSGSGQVLWEGNNPWNYNGGVSGSFSDPEAYLSDLPKDVNEFEADAWKKEQAVKYILSDPQHFIEMSVKKFMRFWHLWPNTYEYHAWYYKLISILALFPVFVLTLMSLYVLRKDLKRLSILYLFIGYYTALHMVTIGSIRYRLPLEPIMIALSSATLVHLISMYRNKMKR